MSKWNFPLSFFPWENKAAKYERHQRLYISWSIKKQITHSELASYISDWPSSPAVLLRLTPSIISPSASSLSFVSDLCQHKPRCSASTGHRKTGVKGWSKHLQTALPAPPLNDWTENLIFAPRLYVPNPFHHWWAPAHQRALCTKELSFTHNATGLSVFEACANGVVGK